VNGYVPAMMPERFASQDAFKAIPEAVGSGPFRYLADERVVGARAAYARYDKYIPRDGGGSGWTAGPKVVRIDRVEYHFMPDAGSAVSAMMTGEMDWWEYAAADLLPVLRRNGQITIAPHSPVGAMAVIRPNHLTPPFNNPDVRRAVLGAITQSDFLIAMMGTDKALWKDGVGVFSPNSPLASDTAMDALTSPRDLGRVRQEIRTAGYKNEKVVVLQSTEIPTQKAMGDVGAALLKEIGFNVDLISTDWGTVSARRAKKDPIEAGGWSCFFTTLNGLDTIDPATHIGLRAHGGRAWFGWPESPELERQRNAWFAADGLEAQKEAGRAIQAQAMKDVPFFPLGMIYPQSARRKNVADVVASVPVFWNVRKI
jgi:peptide/nickel transport system substrate-binding protein